MSRLLRSAVLMLALCCPAFAWASAPTPEGIADIQKLFGIDLLMDNVLQEQFDEGEEFRSLTPEQATCLRTLIRGDLSIAMGESLGETFVDQQTIADWMEFSRTTGGGSFLKVMRDMVVATTTGQPAPDVEAVMTARSPAEQAEVVLFLESPAGRVLRKKFPQMSRPDDAEKERQLEQCGIRKGLNAPS